MGVAAMKRSRTKRTTDMNDHNAHCFIMSPYGVRYRIMRQGPTANSIPGLVVHPEGKRPFHRCLWLHELMAGMFRLIG